jgi:hypothetical protein
MQKLDFVNSVKNITQELLSRQIVDVFNEGFKNSSGSFTYERIIPILFFI